MSNKNVYEKSKENKMSDDMRKARWKALGHMLLEGKRIHHVNKLWNTISRCQ